MRLSKRAADDESLRSIERDIAVAAAETRHLSHDLDPEPLREGRLLHALADSAGRAQGLSLAAVNFAFDENLDEDRLPQRLKVALFYIAQELLYNALKHAEATEISLSLNLPDEKTLLLRCSDNGKGLDSMDTGSGIGLENIRARVATVNGLFSMRDRTGGGLVSEVEVAV
jgi:signal transduction histidine kinase